MKEDKKQLHELLLEKVMVAVDRQKAATKEGVNLIDACRLKWNLILNDCHYYYHGTYPDNAVEMFEDFHNWIMSTSKGDEAFKSTVPEWCETEAEIFIWSAQNPY